MNRSFYLNKLRIKVLTIGICAAFFCSIDAVIPWTWCYTKKNTSKMIAQPGVGFTRMKTPHFNQLVFSWNAFMPEQGDFTFLVRVHYADINKWSEWHRMAEWGEHGCKTFSGKHADGLKYAHVRLELPKNRYANGFQIKVISKNGAPLSLIKMLSVSISNITLFEHEQASAYHNHGSIHIDGVPAWSQMILDHPDARVLCSPTAMCVQASYLAGIEFDPLDFAQGVYDNGLKVYGSWPCNTAYAFHATDGAIFFHVQRLSDFNELLSYLKKDIPVVVSVRGSLPGAPKAYPGGHLLTVVGYDAKKQRVLCHDSAVIPEIHGSILKGYPLSAFLEAWENSHRLSYLGR